MKNKQKTIKKFEANGILFVIFKEMGGMYSLAIRQGKLIQKIDGLFKNVEEAVDYANELSDSFYEE